MMTPTPEKAKPEVHRFAICPGELRRTVLAKVRITPLTTESTIYVVEKRHGRRGVEGVVISGACVRGEDLGQD